MMRSKRLAGTAVLLIGLGLGAASCADDGGYVAYGAYPYDGFYNDAFIGGDFDHRHHFRFHEHGRFDHDGFGHDRVHGQREDSRIEDGEIIAQAVHFQEAGHGGLIRPWPSAC